MAARRKTKLGAEDLEKKKAIFQQVAGNLEEISVEKFLKDNFLPYAWSFVLDRALVDVSGLKPVQRRILYTMYEAGLNPNARRAKVATLGGKVLAYHPHGDSSVVDALKNMGREHIFRVTLISGKGDFGVPGTPGAAGRYIEARLSDAAWLNVKEIGEHAVSMVPNYDDSSVEPARIPVRWPVAVINGGSGIAVGYASSMPSHNPTEIMTACKMLLDEPDLTAKDLMKTVKGPDFNMGGFITSNDGVKEYLETGSGSFKIRGQYEVTPAARGASRIEFHEIPFGTNPEDIISSIVKAVNKGQLQEVASYKNLSDLRHPIRLVVETKPGANSKKVLQDLFKYTSLEVNFSANITTIVDNTPVRSSIRDLLIDFIEFRKLCIFNKTRYNLNKRSERLHLVEGLVKALLDIDAAIAIIRNADDATIANEKLQKKFTIDEKQAGYVLSLQLRRLTKMDRVDLEEEKKKIEDEIDYMNRLLTDADVLREYMKNEFDETLKVIGDERKTVVNQQKLEAFNEAEKNVSREVKQLDKAQVCHITLFENGSVLKTIEPFEYDVNSKKLAHGPIRESLKVKSQEDLIVVGSDGIARRRPATYLALDTVTEASDMGIDLPKDVSVLTLARSEPTRFDSGIFLASRNGEVKLVKPEMANKEEFVVFALTEGDTLISGQYMGRTVQGSSIVSITSGANVLIYDASSLRPTGLAAGGVRGHRLRDGETVVTADWIPKGVAGEPVIISQSSSTIKTTLLSSIPAKSKGAQGVNLHKFKKGETELVNAFTGFDVVISAGRANSVVPAPGASARSAVGTDFKLPSSLGQRTVTPL